MAKVYTITEDQFMILLAAQENLAQLLLAHQLKDVSEELIDKAELASGKAYMCGLKIEGVA